jgi:chromosome segregation ATPase
MIGNGEASLKGGFGMQDLVGLMGYALALISTAAAWLFWRRGAALESDIERDRRSHDETLLASKDLRNELDSFKDRLEKSQTEVRKLRDQLGREKTDSKATVAERAAVLQALEELKAKAERRADHFESQCETLLQQIRAAETSRTEAERRYQEISDEMEHKLKSSRESSENRAGQMREELRALKSEHDQLKKNAELMQEQLKIANPEDIKRHRRKIAHLEHLLMSMRGLKEMAEERNQNWEMALRILSRAILTERSSPRASDEKLGLLVAAAMEAVGHQLVQDEWSQPTLQAPTETSNTDANLSLT